jgi:hypothetical protein
MAMLQDSETNKFGQPRLCNTEYICGRHDTLEADKIHERDFIFLTSNPTCTAAFLDDLVNYHLEACGRGGLGIEPRA